MPNALTHLPPPGCLSPVRERSHVPVLPTSITVRFVDSSADLATLKPQWDSLAEHALYRNAAFEHNFLIPAFEHLSSGKVRVLVAEDLSPSDGKGNSRLLGLMPLIEEAFYHLPIRCFKVWKHEHCFDSTPLLDKDSAVQTFDAMLNFLRQQRIGLLSLDCASAESEVQSVFTNAIQNGKRSLFQRDSFSRAALCPLEAGPEDYIKQFVSKSVKKNHGRLQRRLAEQGEITFEVSDDFSDHATLARQFLDLEASGWKLESGTALRCQDSTCNFYRDLILRSAELGKAKFVSLLLDDQPIAMLSDIQSGRKAFSFKTAFDEKYAQFSPGLQIEMFNIESMHQQGLTVADSCTDPDNAMINRIWGQRLKFQSLVIGLRPGASHFATSIMPWIQKTAKHIRKYRS